MTEKRVFEYSDEFFKSELIFFRESGKTWAVNIQNSVDVVSVEYRNDDL